MNVTKRARAIPYDFGAIKKKALKGPRVNGLLPSFEAIARGDAMVPVRPVVASAEFLASSPEYQEYHLVFQRNFGTFIRHLCASIPYSLEEFVRVGSALTHYLKERGATASSPMSFYETSSADGSVGRTLAEFNQGTLLTLTDSPNFANKLQFEKLCRHDFSAFHLGPFVDITPELLSKQYQRFASGIDVIWENTTFQMYGTYRDEQVAYVKRILKEGGLMIFFEKMNQPSPHEYWRREAIKDDVFKTYYFSAEDIVAKRVEIVSEMGEGQVTLDDFTSVLKQHFTCAELIWNSGNFYEIVASDSSENLECFLKYLKEPFVPAQFSHEPPKALF